MPDQQVFDLYETAHGAAVQAGKEKVLGNNLREALGKLSASEVVTYDVESIQYRILCFATAKTLNDFNISPVKPPTERNSLFAPQFDMPSIQQAVTDKTLDTSAIIETIITNGSSYRKVPESISLPMEPAPKGAVTKAPSQSKITRACMGPPPKRALCGHWQVLVPGHMGSMDNLQIYLPVLADLLGCHLSILMVPNRIIVGEAAAQFLDRPVEVAEFLRYTVRMSAVATLEEYTCTTIQTGVSENIVDWVLKGPKPSIYRYDEIEYWQTTVSAEDVKGKRLQIIEASDVTKKLAASSPYSTSN